MDNTKIAAAYRSVLSEIATVRPSVLRDEPFASFYKSGTSTTEELDIIHKLLLGQYRGLIEQSGLDPDLIPDSPIADIRLMLVQGSAHDLHPDSFNIVSRTTNPELHVSLEKVPSVRVQHQYREWNVLAHPSVVPALREAVRAHTITIDDDALERLKSLASLPPVIGSLEFGPRKTIDCVFAVIAQDFAETLKRQCDARLIDGGSMTYRMPASKLPDVISLVHESPYEFELSSDIAETVQAAGNSIPWDGSLAALADVSLDALHTITPAASKRLTKAGYTNAQSLLFLAPRRYVDRSNPQRISALTEGETAALIATIKSVRVFRQRKMVSYTVSDGRVTTSITFFNALWMANKFSEGDRILVYGKVSGWGKGGGTKLGFTNPLMEHLSENKLAIFGIYPQAHGVTTEDIRAAINELLDRLEKPDAATDANELTVYQALQELHRPTALSDVEPARQRLAYEELLTMQVLLAVEKKASGSVSGISQSSNPDLLASAIAALPYPLTKAQMVAWEEISGDLSSAFPMQRLLQGDVGSGKTTVALLSMLQSLSAGKQVAVLAPTEILASQLYANFDEALTLLEDSGVVQGTHIQLFTNRLRGKTKQQALDDLSKGNIHVAVGTHALLSDGVSFHDLGLVIVDEQHRFGVQQRAQLSESRSDHLRPDTLVMTATPIPRTAALTVFGALDVSTLDELPPGRIPIETHWVDSAIKLDSPQARAWKAVRESAAQGHQSYVVCPLVEESESLNVASATETFTALCEGALAGLSLGLVHGQMKFDERTEVMNRFRDGDIDVLVATTVIEVGVNVPNASTIVILDPQRFGMAQLHQLRGRVGRSSIASHCFLYGKAGSDESRRRLQALSDSTDGFLLSEVDLEIRGPGQVFGSAQSGLSDLNLADLQEDAELLVEARKAAMNIISGGDSRTVHDYVRASVLSASAADWLRKS